MRGRPPLPKAVKVARGNAGKRRLNYEEPDPGVKLPPECPAFLSAEGRMIWEDLAPKLFASDILKQVDQAVLAGLCESYSQAQKASRDIQSRGQMTDVIEVVQHPDGRMEKVVVNRKKNPSVTILKEMFTLMNAFAGKLGLSAADRTRLRVPMGPTKVKDELDQWNDEFATPANVPLPN